MITSGLQSNNFTTIVVKVIKKFYNKIIMDIIEKQISPESQPIISEPWTVARKHGKKSILKILVKFLRPLSINSEGVEEPNPFLDMEGFIPVDLLINKTDLLSIPRQQIIHLLEDNPSKFSIKIENGILYIRTNSEHLEIARTNMKKKKEFTEIVTPMEFCIHGTNKKAWKIIQEQGIKSMTKTFIPFTTEEPERDEAGKLIGSKVCIYLNMSAALEYGIRFYTDVNGRLFSSGINGVIEPSFFLKVVTD